MILKDSFLLYCSRLRLFWWLRSAMRQGAFWIKAKVFGVRYNAKEILTDCRSFSHIVGLTWKSLVFALVSVGFLQYIDPYFYSYYQKYGISIPDDGDYVTFLSTVSGISGVFIGLYYAGISAVSSAIYAKVPNNIRDLLAQERFGNVYMRFLSFLTVLGLILVTLRISGQPRIYLAVPFVTLLAGIGIIAFVKLGQRAFYLFDPTKLSYHIFEQLRHYLRMVKAGGFQWSDKSFQKHAYRQASEALDTLETLADITAKEPHLNGKPFIELSQYLLGFLMHYEQAKRSIPTESGWYQQRYQHRDWYRTDDSKSAIAHQTGTTIQPDITSDKEWVEGRILPILKRCIAVNLAEGKYAEILELFEHVDAYIKCLAREGEVPRAFEFLKDLRPVVIEQITVDPNDQPLEDEVLEKLAVAERVTSFYISVALGYSERLEAFSLPQVEKLLESIRWDSDTDMYRHGLPAYYLPKLEWIKQRLAFEKDVEGNYVTHLWYLSELVRQVEAERLADNVKTLLITSTAIYKEAISQMLSCQRTWLAAAMISREWEYWHKLGTQMDWWEEKWTELAADRKIKGLSWPEFDINQLQAEKDGRISALLILMSEQSVQLAALPRPDSYPDYAGQFLHAAGETAFDALLNNKAELLGHVFPSYRAGCFTRFDSLKPEITTANDWRKLTSFKIACAPLLDLIAISGYARLMADYHGNEQIWADVKAEWDLVKPLSINALVDLVKITDAPFEMAHRSTLRTAWGLRVNSKLQDVPRHEAYQPGAIIADTVIDHDSPLVRIFAEDNEYSLYDGIDVFLELYIRQIEGGDELDFGRKRKSLQEAMRREKQRNLSDEEGESE